MDPTSHSPFHARLPYGRRLSADPLLGGPFFPFDRDVRVVPLDEPVVPEPPRNGEPDGGECFRCAEPDQDVIWRDEHWNVRAGGVRLGIPMIAGLSPNEHMTLHTMTPEVEASMGSVIRRVAMAVSRIPGVGRAHFSRWGDGSEHFHLHFLARPLGMMQMRGALLAAWDDILPDVPDDEVRANIAVVAAAMAEGGAGSPQPGRKVTAWSV